MRPAARSRARRRQQLGELGRVREERGRVAVGAHAEDRHVERPRQARQLVRGLDRPQPRRLRPRDRARRSAHGRLALQQRRAHQRGVRARRGLRHEALVDQRDDHLVPVDRLCPTARAGTPPAWCRRRRRGSRVRVRSTACDRRPATRSASASRQFGARGEFVPVGGCCAGAVHALSCQVRPSRSISAIDADGPQVPAV